MSALHVSAVFLLYCVCSVFCAFSIPLNGKWIITNENRGYNVTGTVPGSMYTALMESKMIQDPYYRKNDIEYRWIARDDWTFTRYFTVSQDQLNTAAIELVCNGLDTIATVLINGQVVGTAENMFRRYKYNIKSVLTVGNNTVSIKFVSAVTHADVVATNYPYSVPPTCVPPQYKGDCHVNMIRKEQCSFSWDWGPSFPSQGIWRDITIEGYNSAWISYFTAETLKNSDGSWDLNVDVFLDTAAEVNGVVEVRLDITQIGGKENVTLTPDQENKVSFNITIPTTMTIKEWWPNGYGSQTLYSLYAFFTSSDGTEMPGKKMKIGFRTVELIQDYVSSNKSHGMTFYFKVNGMPIFLKGSNWIPADSFLERVTRNRTDHLLESAKDVNMNAMRVWGGGVYESEDFYDLADEKGIMLWQDFMFGCAMYPADKAFLDNVNAEVIHQVRRLKHHASIIVWSGNNENEKALRQSWYNTDVNFTLYYNDYVRLYSQTVAVAVRQEDPNRPFIMSSPSNGMESDAEGFVAKEPWSELYGDIHDYRYLDPYYQDSVYRIPRLASEYGLQSYPSSETLGKVYLDSDMEYWSDLNEHRQHHPGGNIEMLTETYLYLPVPNNPDLKEKFKDMIYVTQINQAVGMKTETEHYRRWQNLLDDSGRGNTMGAMYWQLNDIWQAPTWASIDYGGKWKMLHYFAQHFFSPQLIAPYVENGQVKVFMCIDQVPTLEHRHPTSQHLKFHLTNHNGFLFSSFFSNGNPGHVTPSKANHKSAQGILHILMYSWDNFTPLYEWKYPYSVNTTSESIFEMDVNSMLQRANCIRAQNCFLYFHLGDPTNTPTAYLALDTFKNAQGLKKAQCQVTEVTSVSGKRQFQLTLSCIAIAPFVWLDVTGIPGRFSDNGFLMVKPQTTVQFYAWEDTDADTLSRVVTVKSLMDVYYE